VLAVRVYEPMDDLSVNKQRSIEEAVADLLAKYATRPSAELARMIEQLKAEIAERKRPAEARHRSVPSASGFGFGAPAGNWRRDRTM
jgi:hypothetical protein